MEFKSGNFSSAVTPKTSETPIKVSTQGFDQSFNSGYNHTGCSVSKISINDISAVDNSYSYMINSFGTNFSPSRVIKEQELKRLYIELKQEEKILDKRIHAKSRQANEFRESYLTFKANETEFSTEFEQLQKETAEFRQHQGKISNYTSKIMAQLSAVESNRQKLVKGIVSAENKFATQISTLNEEISGISQKSKALEKRENDVQSTMNDISSVQLYNLGAMQEKTNLSQESLLMYIEDVISTANRFQSQKEQRAAECNTLHTLEADLASEKIEIEKTATLFEEIHKELDQAKQDLNSEQKQTEAAKQELDAERQDMIKIVDEIDVEKQQIETREARCEKREALMMDRVEAMKESKMFKVDEFEQSTQVKLKKINQALLQKLKPT